MKQDDLDSEYFVRVLKFLTSIRSEFDAGYQLHYEVLLGQMNSGQK
jgi:hypothetical protein